MPWKTYFCSYFNFLFLNQALSSLCMLYQLLILPNSAFELKKHQRIRNSLSSFYQILNQLLHLLSCYQINFLPSIKGQFLQSFHHLSPIQVSYFSSDSFSIDLFTQQTYILDYVKQNSVFGFMEPIKKNPYLVSSVNLNKIVA